MSQDQTRFYRHYKNKPYKFLGSVRHSETLEEMALYETLYENELGKLWVRPYDMFFENVQISGVTRPRFEKIGFEFKTAEVFSEGDYVAVKALYQECFGRELNEFKFRSRIEAHKKFLFLKAYEKEQLVGFKFGYAHDGNLFYSWLGAVSPAYQKLGVASALIRMQHQWCTAKGFTKIETRTYNEFAAMLRLNLKFGFKVTGTKAGRNNDLKIILEKIL